jgi:2-furoyl-CoA dehydrogenase large subunit
MEGAFKNDGTLVGLRIKQIEKRRRVSAATRPRRALRMHSTSSGPYRVRHISIDNRAVVTNQVAERIEPRLWRSAVLYIQWNA